ncbi:hypothetical protein TrLO_g315 [Triparma laevis f. longispina]|uniref:Dynein axonemal intermediate chain 4 n=1 Tax=Triparma laevis f. longispina TaxID=1714387 RepID=A0A9W7E2T8_9STRA|nr:hypothetical protein TrLO_g315 [Triparma laevis f. longispina]
MPPAGMSKRPAVANTAPTPTAAAKGGAKSTKRGGAGAPEAPSGLPSILLDSVDRTPQPLYVSSYELGNDSGVDAVGGLKVGSDEGIKYPTTAKAPIAVTITTPTVTKRKVETYVKEDKRAVKEEEVEDDGKKHKHKHGHGHSTTVEEEVEEKAEEEFVITLTETKTSFLINIRGTIMSNDAPNYQKIQKRNTAYSTILEGRDHADNLSERHTQTLSFAHKTKVVQSEPPSTKSMSCQATDWDIYDSYKGDEKGEGEDIAVQTQGKIDSKGVGKEESSLDTLVNNFTSALSAPDCLLDVSEALVTPSTGSKSASDFTNSENIISDAKNGSIMGSPTLLKSLELMERAVQQNLNHKSHLRYRDYPEGGEAEVVPQGKILEGEGGSQVAEGGVSSSMSKLFSFSCKLSEGRSATTMSWNKGNKDVLAVGYGNFHLSASEVGGGMIMFWSIRNPAHPEKVIKTPSGVTSIDFSSAHPNMIAVGMYNGTVAVYDVRRDVDFDVPVLESGSMEQKHMDPVWECKWVDKGPERGESLVTIATDGRVLEWNMKKGLTLTPLMVLKRIGNSDGVISRQASGLCLDFPLDDSSTYLAGTEDGHIHRCSCSYNEQYLDTFSGHSGPVYKVKCSPYHPDAFLSCSADWTVKLWHSKDSSDCLREFHTVGLSDVVNDIAWSPNSSTVFASVTGDGRVEVWDLNSMDPKMSYKPPANEAILGVTPLTTVLFSGNAPVLATGDAKGKVNIFRLVGMETGGIGGESEQRKKLEGFLKGGE